MRTISRDIVVEKVRDLCIDSNFSLPIDVVDALQLALVSEKSELGREILSQILDNSVFAKMNKCPLCQDTGVAVFFVELGRELCLPFDLYEVINEGVRLGYRDGYLRKSIVSDPLKRINTCDNTPAIVYLKIVDGSNLTVSFLAKGGGAENTSVVKMLTPAHGIKGIEEFVMETVKNAGANACPPIIVGIGIGGTMEKSALMAKEVLLRQLNSKHSDPIYSQLEFEWLSKINKLGIGPMGLGGDTTALAVMIQVHATHIASLPVAINIQCHSSRHGRVIL